MATASSVIAAPFPASATFDPLLKTPDRLVRGNFAGSPFEASVGIPHYDRRIATHYSDVAPQGIAAASARARIPFTLPQFGLIVAFDAPVDIAVHDDAMVLADPLRDLVTRFGVLILRNAAVDKAVRDRFHRNIFPHLRFHVDRGAQMPNQISCFTRNPHDAEQRHPRKSSTLFMANLVAWLECRRHAAPGEPEETGVRTSYDLYARTRMSEVIGETVLEQPWTAPEGTGEIAVIDNRLVLHATYNRVMDEPGYRIGARYLS